MIFVICAHEMTVVCAVKEVACTFYVFLVHELEPCWLPKLYRVKYYLHLKDLLNSNKMNSARMWKIVFSLIGLLPVEVFRVNIIHILILYTLNCLECFFLSHCENCILFLCGNLYVVIYHLHSNRMWNGDCSLGVCYIF